MDIDVALRHLAVLNPSFPSRLEGATPDEIETLEHLIQRPLPTSYRRYLERLGRNDGGLHEGTMFDFRVGSLISHYREASWGVQPPLMLIGLCPTDGMAMLPMCLDGVDPVDPELVLPTLQDGIQYATSYCAHSLGEWVFRQGYAALFAYNFAFEGNAQLMAPDPEKMRRLEEVIRAEGLARHPASEGFSSYFIRPDLTVEVVYGTGHDRATITVHGKEESVVEELLGRFEREAGSVTWGLQATEDAHSHLAPDLDEPYEHDDEGGDDDDPDTLLND